MLNIPIIYRALGTLLYIEGILLALCLGLGCWFGETNHLAFGVYKNNGLCQTYKQRSKC